VSGRTFPSVLADVIKGVWASMIGIGHLPKLDALKLGANG
jgi:hypothetical protein